MLNSLSVDCILTRSTWSLICQRHGHVVMCNKIKTSDEHRLLYQRFSIFCSITWFRLVVFSVFQLFGFSGDVPSRASPVLNKEKTSFDVSSHLYLTQRHIFIYLLSYLYTFNIIFIDILTYLCNVFMQILLY